MKDIMKIFKKRNKKGLLKWACYVITAYLLASWGVNETVNPMHYMKNMQMKKITLEAKETSNGYALHFPENVQNLWQYGFLSFSVVQSEDYFWKSKLCGYTENGKTESEEQTLSRGWNCIDLSKKSWTAVEIPKKSQETVKLQLKDVWLTKYRTVDTAKMIYITMSLLALAVFWESVWWVKQKYAS